MLLRALSVYSTLFATCGALLSDVTISHRQSVAAFRVGSRNQAIRWSPPTDASGIRKNDALLPVNTRDWKNEDVPCCRRLKPLAALPTGPALMESMFASAGNVPIWQAGGLNLILFLALRSKLLKVLTEAGFWHAFALGTGLWTTLGWKGWTLCVGYLFLGSTVTKIRFEEKEKQGIAEGRGGRRGPENTWGSAATGLACAICSARGPSFLGIRKELFVLGYVASLATKLSDTFASEVGKAYGKTTFLITTFERVMPGTEGAVSLEGTAASVLGGSILSAYGCIVGLIRPTAVPLSIAAAFIATNVESLLGATLQGKENLEWITNDVVNFLNTLIGAVLAIAAGMSFL